MQPCRQDNTVKVDPRAEPGYKYCMLFLFSNASNDPDLFLQCRTLRLRSSSAGITVTSQQRVTDALRGLTNVLVLPQLSAKTAGREDSIQTSQKQRCS